MLLDIWWGFYLLYLILSIFCLFNFEKQFKSPMARLPTLIFDHAPTPSPQIFEQLLIFVNLYQHAKNQLFQLFILQFRQFQEPTTKLITPLFDYMFKWLYVPQMFKNLSICMNLYQHAKNWLIPSSDTVNFRVQRQWSHPFLAIPNQKMFA